MTVIVTVEECYKEIVAVIERDIVACCNSKLLPSYTTSQKFLKHTKHLQNFHIN